MTQSIRLDFLNLSEKQSRCFNETLLSSRTIFTELIKSFSDINNHNEFHFSPIGSRDPYMTPLFYSIHQFTFLVETFSSQEKIEIYNANEYLKKIVEENFPSWKVNTVVREKKYNWKRFPLVILRLLVLFFIGCVHSKKKYTAPVIFLETFLFKEVLKNKGLQDRYYAGLLEKLSEAERKNILFLPQILFSIKEIPSLVYRIFTNNELEHFLFKESYLSISDFLRACLFYRSLKKTLVFPEIKIKEIDCSSLFRDVLHDYRFHPSSIQAFLNYFFVKRISQEGFKVNLLIDWFENQVIDKGLNKGFSNFFPTTQRKGYAGFCIDPLFNFHLPPLEIEVANNYSPESIVVVGDKQAKKFQEFFSNMKTEVGPAFRFSFVFSMSNHLKKNLTHQILVGLPTAKNTADCILSFVSEVAVILEDFTFIVKPHPLMLEVDFSRIKHLPNVTVSKSSVSELLRQTSYTLCAMSSLCLEAVIAGNFVFILNFTSIVNQNPIRGSVANEFWKDIWNPSELIESLKNIQFPSSFPEAKDYFCRPEKDNVKRFLNL